jgi:hypothetical protein
LHFADEAMAKMVMNACGGTEEATEAALAALSEGVQAFMGFANAAQLAFFASRI